MKLKSCLFHLLRSWDKQPAVQAATLSALCGSFIVVAASLLIQQNLETLLTKWGSEVKVNVYLERDIRTEKKLDVQKKLEASGLFAAVEYVSKDQAIKRFQKRLGNMAPTFFSDNEFENPLPESFEMILRRKANTLGSYDKLVALAGSLRSQPGVEEVSYGQEWLHNYASAVTILRWLGWTVILVLMAGALLVIGNAIRSAVYQQRQEIEILELFGATRGRIMLPFVFEGAVLGFFASVISLIVSLALFGWFMNSVGESLNFWNLKEHVTFLSTGKSLLFIFMGSVAGALGSYLCVRQVSTGWSASEARNQ